MTTCELTEGFGEQCGAGASEARDPKLPSLETGDRLELALGLLEPGERRLGVTDERLARLVQFGPVSRPVEKRHPDLPFQGGHLLAHRRLREIERLRRGRERALASHLAEHPESLQIEHKWTLSGQEELSVALIPRTVHPLSRHEFSAPGRFPSEVQGLLHEVR